MARKPSGLRTAIKVAKAIIEDQRMPRETGKKELKPANVRNGLPSARRNRPNEPESVPRSRRPRTR